VTPLQPEKVGTALVLVVLQADFQLTDRLIRRFERFHAMPAKVMRGTLHMLLRPRQTKKYYLIRPLSFVLRCSTRFWT